jgi:hypothetical protein
MRVMMKMMMWAVDAGKSSYFGVIGHVLGREQRGIGDLAAPRFRVYIDSLMPGC